MTLILDDVVSWFKSPDCEFLKFGCGKSPCLLRIYSWSFYLLEVHVPTPSILFLWILSRCLLWATWGSCTSVATGAVLVIPILVNYPHPFDPPYWGDAFVRNIFLVPSRFPIHCPHTLQRFQLPFLGGTPDWRVSGVRCSSKSLVLWRAFFTFYLLGASSLPGDLGGLLKRSVLYSSFGKGVFTRPIHWIDSWRTDWPSQFAFRTQLDWFPRCIYFFGLSDQICRLEILSKSYHYSIQLTSIAGSVVSLSHHRRRYKVLVLAMKIYHPPYLLWFSWLVDKECDHSAQSTSNTLCS